jgi:hypothetical protein
MSTAPGLKPPNESARLHTLATLNVLDTPADPVLDGLVRSAATVLGCPISAVSLSDADRQWFKARVGLTAAEIPREHAFCAQAIGLTIEAGELVLHY